jgi:CAAX prenyl protease-like protein
MGLLRQELEKSPVHARVIPYVLIVLLTAVQDSFEGPGRYWLYFGKMVVGLWCILEMRSLVQEIRWAVSWEAIAVGVLVCVIWVGLDPFYPKIELLFKAGNPWNPIKQFEAAPAMGWFFVAVRTFGSAIIVPPLEEAFFRSFLYRYLIKTDFEKLPFNYLHWLSLIVTSAIFGLVHYQWLAGFLCGLFYQGLVIRKNRLGDAMTAHAITNFLLGIWIVWRNDWHFW